jgi:hypothetical protein
MESQHIGGFSKPHGFFRFRILLTVTAALVCTLLVGAKSFAQQDLSALIDDARNNFKPITQHQVDESRSEVKQRMNEFERFVGPSTQNGKRWLRYLKWDALKDQIDKKDAKTLDAIQDTLSKLNRNVNGVEKPQFRALAKALQRYHDTLAISLVDKQEELFNQQLTGLEQDMNAYRKEPSPRTELALSERIRILDSFGGTRKLIQEVRRELAHPNAFVDVTTSYIAAGVDPLNRTEPITDCILGTDIHGTAHTTGSNGVSSIPSENKAVLEFISDGHSFSRNVGYNSPAVIHSTADTDFTATKRVELSDAAFKSRPANANATTDTHIHSVAKQGGGLGSRLVSRIGWKKAMQSEGQAEAIAADHAETRVERSFNREVDDQLVDLRKRYEEDYRRPLERQGEVPDHIRFSSGKRSLSFEATQANRSQLGAQGAPPEGGQGHDVTMRLHESAVNNYASSILGGATATQDSPDEDVKFNVDLPRWMKRMWENRKTEGTNDPTAKDEPFKKYAMTLRDGRPLSVGFVDGKVNLTLHIAELKSGDKTFTDWDVTGTYIPELADGRIMLRRDGKLTMLPADFSGSLDTQQTAERSNLERELDKRSAQGKGFPQSIEFDPVKPEGKLAQAGALEYREFSSQDGWAVMGLDREGKRRQ